MSQPIHSLRDLTLAANPTARFLETPGRDPLDYRTLAALCARTCRGLRGLGLGQTSRVALVVPNGPEAVTTFVAFASAAECAPLNPDYRGPELRQYLDDLHPGAVAVLEGFASPVREVARELGIRVIELAPEAGGPAGSFTLRFEGAACPEAPARDGDYPGGEDTALVLHTSGTTARPKIVQLSHRNLLASGRNIRDTLALTPADRCFNVMPLYHIHGLIGVVTSSLTAGATVIAAGAFEAGKFFRGLREFQPSWYSAVPTIHQAILSAVPSYAELAASAKLRLIRSSSASLPPSVMHLLESVFHVPVIEAYGMTEATHQMASNPLPAVRKPGSVGLAAGPRIAIMSEAGELLGAGATGEVVIQGTNVFEGYAGNAEANQASFTNGWFRTGDVGHLDEDGYLFLTGRKKELINHGGEKISPREIEEALLDHPAVAQAVCFAIPHSTLGEAVGAAIVARKDLLASEAELRLHVSARLSAFKVPVRILVVDRIPTGSTGKIQRIGAHKHFEALLAARGTAGPAPTGELARAIAEIWKRSLGVKELGAGANFLLMGGNSLSAARMLAEVREQTGRDVKLAALYDHPTLGEFSRVVEGLGKVERVAGSVTGGSANMTQSQLYFWLLSRFARDSILMVSRLELRGRFDEVRLRAAVGKVVGEEKLLWTRYARHWPKMLQERPARFDFPARDLSSAADPEEALRRAEKALTASRRGIDDLPQVGMELLRLAPDRHVLLFVMPHIVADATARQIFARRISDAYLGKAEADPVASHADYLQHERVDCASTLAKDITYWRDALEGHKMPRFPAGALTPNLWKSPAEIRLAPGTLEAVEAACAAKGISVTATLMSALARAVAADSRQEKLLFLNARPLRTHSRFAGTFGPMVGSEAVRIVLREKDECILKCAARTQKLQVESHEHANMPGFIAGTQSALKSWSRSKFLSRLMLFLARPHSPGAILANLAVARSVAKRIAKTQSPEGRNAVVQMMFDFAPGFLDRGFEFQVRDRDVTLAYVDQSHDHLFSDHESKNPVQIFSFSRAADGRPHVKTNGVLVSEVSQRVLDRFAKHLDELASMAVTQRASESDQIPA